MFDPLSSFRHLLWKLSASPSKKKRSFPLLPEVPPGPSKLNNDPFKFPLSLTLDMNTASFICVALHRKEVIQPHLPIRLPCYDLAPVTGFALGRSLRSRTSGTPSFHGLTGGVYKARERIHRAMADARLLANPTSWRRVSASNPN